MPILTETRKIVLSFEGCPPSANKIEIRADDWPSIFNSLELIRREVEEAIELVEREMDYARVDISDSICYYTK